MLNEIGWKKANQKRKFLDRQCPEWLWISIFVAIFIGSVAMNRDLINFGSETVAQAQTSQSEVETPSTRQEMAKNGVVGVASFYDYDLNGIEWSKSHDTCASRDFKRYSTIRVTNLDNGKSVDCYVNDYGPEIGQTPERHIDLSSHAFSKIANLKLGLINVRIEEI